MDKGLDVDIVVQLIASASMILTTTLSLVLGYVLNKNSKEKQKEVEKTTPLIQHKCHTNIKEYQRLIRTTEYHSNQARNTLIHDFLTSKYQAWGEAMGEFAIDIDACVNNCKTNCEECNLFYGKAMHMFEKGMEYEQRLYFEGMSGEDIETVRIFKNKFKEFHQDRVDRFKSKIEEISFNNTALKDCNLKGYVLLDTLDEALYSTQFEAEKAMRTLNGTLTNKKYRNMVC